jgi:hypothetical protein
VDVDDGVEVVVAHLPQHGVTKDSRVGDEGVEAPELVHRCGHELGSGLRGAHRCDDGDGPAPGRLNGCHGIGGGLGVDVVDDDGRALPGELLCVGEAEAASGSGDDGDFAVQRHGYSFVSDPLHRKTVENVNY